MWRRELIGSERRRMSKDHVAGGMVAVRRQAEENARRILVGFMILQSGTNSRSGARKTLQRHEGSSRRKWQCHR
jgi:hypothetical protein